MWCCMQIGKQCWTSWKSLWNFRLHTGQGLRRPICSSSPNRKGKISIWITLLYWSHTKIFAREILIRKRTTNSSTHQHRKLLFIVHTVQYDKNSFPEISSRTTLYLLKGGFATMCHCGVIQKFCMRGHTVMIFRIFKRAPPHIKCQFLGWNSALWCNLSSAGGSSFPRKFPNYANPQNIERFSFFIGLGNILSNNANICNNCCQGLESFEATITPWMDKVAGGWGRDCCLFWGALCHPQNCAITQIKTVRSTPNLKL